MPTQIFPPACLIQVYTRLYPTLRFSRVRFFEGIPFALNTGQPAITVPDPGGLCGINVYLRANTYDPCSKATFLTLAHELVHALQIQDGIFGGCGIGLLNPFIAEYITCFLNSRSTHRANAFEREAYDFVNGPIDPGDPPGRVKTCVDSLAPLLPCDCDAIPWPGVNAAFQSRLFASCRNLSKRKSEASFADCLGEQGGQIGTLTGTVIGAVIGGLIGGPAGIVIGAAIGAVIGAFTSLANAIAGIFASIIGGLIAGIISVIGDLIDAIGDFFSGDGVGSIALMFSTDRGLTFGNKIRLERSSEPPALAGTADRLYLSWIGTDNRLNLFGVPKPPRKEVFDRSNDDAGPALALTAMGQLAVVWQDDDNHLHVKFAAQPPAGSPFLLGPRIDLGESLAGSASPGLASFGGRLYVAWIDSDNRIFIKTSLDGVNWTPRIPVNERSPDDGTPAITTGNGRLYLAWTGTDDDNHLNVKTLVAFPNGGLQPGLTVALPHRSSDDAGPALTFDNGRLFLAWTDNNQRVKTIFSDDPDARIWSPPIDLGHSSDNAGPALAIVSSIICVGFGLIRFGGQVR